MQEALCMCGFSIKVEEHVVQLLNHDVIVGHIVTGDIQGLYQGKLVCLLLLSKLNKGQ